MQFGCFWTNGQICSSTSRLLVQEGIAQAFYARLKQRAESIKIGNPLEEDCRLGPVVAESQHSKIMGFIQVRAFSLRSLLAPHPLTMATPGFLWPAHP